VGVLNPSSAWIAPSTGKKKQGRIAGEKKQVKGNT
jgi:hypothetical protein